MPNENQETGWVIVATDEAGGELRRFSLDELQVPAMVAAALREGKTRIEIVEECRAIRDRRRAAGVSADVPITGPVGFRHAGL